MTLRRDPLLDALAAAAREEEMELEMELEQLLANWPPLAASEPAPAPIDNERFYRVARQGLNPGSLASQAQPPPAQPVDQLAQRRAARRPPNKALSIPAVLLAVAAGLVFWFRGPSSSSLSGFPPLPEYDISMSGGQAASRGGTEPGPQKSHPGPVRLTADAQIDLVLRPESNLAAGLAVETFLRPPAGPAQPLHLPLQISPSGTIRLSGDVATLFPGQHGPATLGFVLRDGQARSPGRKALEGEANTGPGWRRLLVPIEFAEPTP